MLDAMSMWTKLEAAMYLLRTIPQGEKPDYVEEYFDGTYEGEMDFSLPSRLRRAEELRYVALVHRGQVYGRLRVLRVEEVDQSVEVGNVGRVVSAKTKVWVRCPGERAGERVIPRRSTRGFVYDTMPEWP